MERDGNVVKSGGNEFQGALWMAETTCRRMSSLICPESPETQAPQQRGEIRTYDQTGDPLDDSPQCHYQDCGVAECDLCRHDWRGENSGRAATLAERRRRRGVRPRLAEGVTEERSTCHRCAASLGTQGVRSGMGVFFCKHMYFYPFQLVGLQFCPHQNIRIHVLVGNVFGSVRCKLEPCNSFTFEMVPMASQS